MMDAPALDRPIEEKMEQLKASLRSMGKVLIAFSGGVDSSLLLKVAVQSMGIDAQAVFVKTPLHARRDERRAKDIAKEIGAELVWIELPRLDEDVQRNGIDRCYMCKKRIFNEILALGEKSGATVIDGTNADDLFEDRPGRRALRELDVHSPLAEVGLTKAEVRQLAKGIGLSNWNAPSETCLATRVPFGSQLTNEALGMIEGAEEDLRGLGLTIFRVRALAHSARVEVAKEELSIAFMKRQEIVSALKHRGFETICLDLEGYRTGGAGAIGPGNDLPPS